MPDCFPMLKVDDCTLRNSLDSADSVTAARIIRANENAYDDIEEWWNGAIPPANYIALKWPLVSVVEFLNLHGGVDIAEIPCQVKFITNKSVFLTILGRIPEIGDLQEHICMLDDLIRRMSPDDIASQPAIHEIVTRYHEAASSIGPDVLRDVALTIIRFLLGKGFRTDVKSVCHSSHTALECIALRQAYMPTACVSARDLALAVSMATEPHWN